MWQRQHEVIKRALGLESICGTSIQISSLGFSLFYNGNNCRSAFLLGSASFPQLTGVPVAKGPVSSTISLRQWYLRAKISTITPHSLQRSQRFFIVWLSPLTYNLVALNLLLEKKSNFWISKVEGPLPFIREHRGKDYQPLSISQ